MNTTPQQPEPGKNASSEEIEADIAATRDRLAENVEALAAKVDVKARARAKLNETRASVGRAAQRVQNQAADKVRSLPRPARFAIPAVFAALIAAIVVATRRRRSE